MLKIFYSIVLWEFKEFYRNPATLFWAVGFPIILSIVLGFAFFQKKQPVTKVGILNSSDELLLKLKSKDTKSRFEFIPVTKETVGAKIKKGQITLYLYVRESQIEFHLDSKNQDSYLAYLELKNILSENVSKEKTKLIEIETRGDRYIDFLIPGLLALGIMNSCVWGTGYSLMEMRIKKLMKRMIASPLPKWLFLFSHLFTRIILSGFDFLALLAVAHLFFDVKLQGDISGVLIIYLSGMIAFFGIAVFISSRAENTQVANGLTNTVTFPLTLLCGVFYSYENFPQIAVRVIQYLPLSLVADTLRSIFNEGAGASVSFIPSIILLCTGTFFFAIGIKIYKWD